MSALMTQEFGAASNIKSRVTRQAVQSAITSARQRLTLYNSVPPNGLVIYCGDITLDGKAEIIPVFRSDQRKEERATVIENR